jgi:hypothetical protein
VNVRRAAALAAAGLAAALALAAFAPGAARAARGGGGGGGIRIDIGGGGMPSGTTSAIRLSADPIDLHMGETTLVTVEIDAAARGGESWDTSKLKLDGFDLVDSEELTTASFSSRTPRGSFTFERRVRHYLLRPRAAGHFVLGPIDLTVGRDRVSSEAVTVTVRDAAAGAGAGAGAPDAASGASAAGGTGAPEPDSAAPVAPPLDDPTNALVGLEPDEVEKLAFAHAVLSKERAFVGEQVTLSYYIFIAADYGLAKFEVALEPKFDGAWSEELLPPMRKEEFTRVMVFGRPYEVALARRKALFATAPGPLAVPPIGFAMSVAPKRFLGFRRPEDLNVRTRTRSIDVVGLPAAGRPPGMEPSSVGTMALTASAADTVVRVGEPVSLVVELTSTGNYRVTRPPSIAKGALDGFEVYDPTTTNVDESDELVVKGRRHVEQLLLPRRAGTFTIPPLELPYFDPADRAYHVARTKPIVVTVTGDPAGAPPPPGTASGKDGADGAAPPGASAATLGPLRSDAALGAPRAPLHARAPFWALVGAGPGLLALVWMGQALAAWRRRIAPALAVKRADGAALRRLRAAMPGPAATDGTQALAEVHRTLLEFVQAKCGERIGGWTNDEIRARLPRLGFDGAAVDALAALVAECESARYAPSPPSAAAARAAAERAAGIVAELAHRRAA